MKIRINKDVVEFTPERAAEAAQFRKNSQNELFLRNSDIVTMRFSAGTLRRSGGRCKSFGQFCPKSLHPNKAN